MIICLRAVDVPADVREPGSPPRTSRPHASAVHQVVDYRPITRYDMTGGYLNLPGLHRAGTSLEEEP